MKEKTLALLIGLVLLLVGYYCVYEYANGYVVLGLFLAQWGDNICQKFN